MKKTIASLLATSALLSQSWAEEAAEPALKDSSPQDIAARIAESSEELAEVQDELSADVMELVESQTVPKVIELLEKVEKIMAEVTDDLIEGETGGPTMAAQTDIIETILDAAKQKQQSQKQEGGEPQDGMDAMMNMMERMTGKEPGEEPGEGEGDGKGEGEGEGEKPGKNAGQGQTGDSDTANEKVNGKIGDDTERRIIPKSSSPAGRGLPNEFRKLLDAYNKNDSKK